jgi:hypothetical protein
MTDIIEQEPNEENSFIFEGDFILSNTRTRNFKTLSAMVDYIRVFGVESGQFVTGHMQGEKIIQLVYNTVN